MDLKLSPADVKVLEMRAKRGDARAAQMLGALYSGAAGAGRGGGGLPALIDANKPEPVPAENQAPVRCGKCGGDLFEVLDLLKMVRDAREADQPTHVGSGKVQHFRCLLCRSIWFWSLKKDPAAGDGSTPRIIGAEPKPGAAQWIEWTLLSEGDEIREFGGKILKSTLLTVGKVLDTALGDEKRADELMGLILKNLGIDMPVEPEAAAAAADKQEEKGD